LRSAYSRRYQNPCQNSSERAHTKLERTRSHGTLHASAPISATRIPLRGSLWHLQDTSCFGYPRRYQNSVQNSSERAPSKLESTHSHGTLHAPTPSSAARIALRGPLIQPIWSMILKRTRRHGTLHNPAPFHAARIPWKGPSGVRGHSARYATGHIPEAQCAFKILMIHEDLQFALRIAFRCVIHRGGSLDIRC